jgi:hypothetical protein
LAVKDLPDDVAMSLAGIEHGERGTKIRLSDRIKALELLGRHFALFTDRIEAQVHAAGTVNIYLPHNERDGHVE